jgi:hypothetical protein
VLKLLQVRGAKLDAVDNDKSNLLHLGCAWAKAQVASILKAPELQDALNREMFDSRDRSVDACVRGCMRMHVYVHALMPRRRTLDHPRAMLRIGRLPLHYAFMRPLPTWATDLRLLPPDPVPIPVLEAALVVASLNNGSFPEHPREERNMACSELLDLLVPHYNPSALLTLDSFCLVSGVEWVSVLPRRHQCRRA